MHCIDESAAGIEYGVTVRVRVLSDDGTAATICVEDCGAVLRQGQTVTVPSDAVRRRR